MNTKALLAIVVAGLGLVGCAAKQEAASPQAPTTAPAAAAPATDDAERASKPAEDEAAGAAAPAPPPAKEQKTQDAKQKGGVIVDD